MHGTTRRRADEPLSRDSLFRLVGPLVAVTLSGLLSTTASSVPPEQAHLIMQAALLTAVTVAATAFVPWGRLPRSLQTIPPIVYLVVAFLIQQAAENSSSVAPVALLPVVWLAVYGTEGELLGGLAAVTIILAAPMLIAGPDGEPLAKGFFLIGTAWILGFVVHQLFGQMRAHTNRLEVLAREDGLTSVANRRGWDEALDRAVRNAARLRQPLCVAVLDLDHFKDYNDERGHQAGDQLLCLVAAAWTSELRSSDLLARLGGDEFGVILAGCAPEGAGAVTRRLCSVTPGGGTCSAGVAAWNGVETPGELFARADAALYRAKNAGRDRVTVAEWTGDSIITA